MPCYAETIVRIKYVRKGENESNSFGSIWAIGTYPVGREDYEIEMTLFIPTDLTKRDSDTQAIFEKNEFYSVGGKIVLGKYNNSMRLKMTVSSSTHLRILDKVPESNKCPLKVSLVGIAQEVPNEINDDENAVFDMSVNDYVGKDYKFNVKIAYPYLESRFRYLKNVIRGQESVVFVVGHMEIIDDDLFVYAKDINNIDMVNKRTILDENGLQTSSTKANSAWSKLLSTYKKVFKNLGTNSNKNISLDDISSKGQDNLHSSKHVRIDNADEVEDTVVDEVDSRKDDYGGYESQSEGNVFMDNKGKKRSNHDYKKGKIHATRSTAHKSSKLSYSNNDEEE
ncbi:hypothetical protein C2G38_2187240 [Gigaspora rosea]|uniref:Uncharacterized protein n=1 Tax=Gigaspora rosea TaxID=44941 RepID=A0A397V6B2_9GLOM|nr:hypothetical protein C2G38_2187240 [Gigaspora rosea]